MYLFSTVPAGRLIANGLDPVLASYITNVMDTFFFKESLAVFTNVLKTTELEIRGNKSEYCKLNLTTNLT